MIIIKIWGGLGNQLFQYAFGYALSRETHEKLLLDIDFFNKQYSYVGKRRFELGKLNIHVDTIKRKGVILILENFVINRLLRRYSPQIILFFINTIFIKEYKKIYKTPFLPKKNKTNYYDGYWQTSRYFEKYRDDLLNIFKYDITCNREVSFYISKMQKSESVSIHIRRGDFKENSRIGHYIEMDYYYRAMNYIVKKIDNPVFFVFSDDMNWVKDNFEIDAKIVYIEHKSDNPEIVDLMLMAKCKHGIMSASTFSWWGNWLKEGYKSSIIIAPKGRYFNDCFIEDNWIQI